MHHPIAHLKDHSHEGDLEKYQIKYKYKVIVLSFSAHPAASGECWTHCSELWVFITALCVLKHVSSTLWASDSASLSERAGQDDL